MSTDGSGAEFTGFTEIHGGFREKGFGPRDWSADAEAPYAGVTGSAVPVRNVPDSQ